MKLKSILVIALSSILISAVILLTIVALSLFINYKENESARRHNESLASLNARLYGRYVTVRDIRAKYEKRGIHKGKCLLEGLIKNNGYRTLSSVELKVDFLNASGYSIHTERLHPLAASIMPRKTTIAALSLITSGREVPILPGKSLRFTHVLSEQKDKNIVSPIKNRRYATNPKEWSGDFNHRITRIRF